MGPLHQSQKGTVTLVALCLVAVLGITLASYIAVCSRAMNLSNRSFQTGLSQQLAEAGLEEGLRAFNKNDWSGWSNGTAATWTLDATNHRASCNVTFPASKFSQGVTGSLKIRVDNYDAAQLPATWSSTANYSINDLVGSGGVWYRCVQNGNLNKNPATQTDLAWWVPAPIPWAWSSNTNYTTNSDVVCSGGTWYWCSTNHTSGSTFAVGSNWTAIQAPSLSWSSSTAYTFGAFVFSNGTWYVSIQTPNTNHAPPNASYWTAASSYISWAWRSGASYSFNNLVFYSTSGSGTWYRCILPHSNHAPPNTTYWENALSDSWAWASTNAYNLNDVVYSGGSFYRCILAHTNHAPPNATYWSNAPLYSTAWDSGRQYSQNDTVRYNGVWYLSLQNNNIQNPATAITYWIGANTANASYTWNAASAYTVGNYRCYGGMWYTCIAAHTGKSPNDTTYWSASWLNSSGMTLGAPVVYAEGTINITGSPSTKTQLRATIAPASPFPNAAGATSTISANSGGTVDSYDSSMGTYASQVGTSTNFSAVVAAGYTAGTAVTLSSTAVKGYIAVPSGSSSPYAPLFSSGGSVKGASSPGSPNIDLAHISRSPYIPIFDTLPGGAGGLAANWATVPKGTALSLSTLTIDIGTPGATTPSRYYYNGNLTIGSATVNYLHINGPVILYVNGDLFITASGSTGRIDINSAGSAEIHVAGAFKADIGGDGILNQTANPKSLIIICDTTSTATHFYSEGVNPLYGVVYVPYSTSNTGYFNDNTSTNIYGAVSANKITYSGADLNIHYDTSLRYATFGGVNQPFTITEWRELTAQIDKATMP